MIGVISRAVSVLAFFVIMVTQSSIEAPAAGAALEKILAGSAAFRRTNLALFFGGFSTFWLLYWVQPLLPAFAQTFSLTPAQASVAMSCGTGGLAICLFPAGLISDRFGRKSVMCVAMLGGAALTFATSFVHEFWQILLLRTLAGVVLSGLPAVAMAYLAEEIHPVSLGASMGLYIAGSALGGMTGRLATSLIVDFTTWHVACGIVGAVGLFAGWMFWRNLPESRFFVARSLPISVEARRALWTDLRTLFTDPGLPWLFATGFLLLGCFVSMYNYLEFRLESAPFALSNAQIGLIFTLYLSGTVSSTFAGRLADKFGRRRVLWALIAPMLLGLALVLSTHLLLVIIGLAMFTVCFFGAHTVASSWVGRRAGRAKALGASLYLTGYYLGSSVLGSVVGMFWSFGHWWGVCGAMGVLVVINLCIGWRLRKLEPKELIEPVSAAAVPTAVKAAALAARH